MAKAEAKRSISVVERRLQTGSIFAVGTGGIPLKEPRRWTLRIVNSEVRNGRVHEMQHEKGWQFAEIADLAVEPYEVGFTVLDGRIVRGAHGQEVLMKMAQTDFSAVQAMKDADNRKNTFGEKAVKQAIVTAAGREQGGAQGADFLDRAVKSIQIQDSAERVPLED